jgi:branched-chain amino acid transport system substrate-binding protein
MYLDQVGGKAGKFNITLKTYDDSTAAKGAWDDAACAKNGTDHVANTNEVAVMGTFNSGCAKIEVPTLNQDSTGPMLMVSHANTNPGLTKKWETGEPDKYYPTGVRTTRVVTTDDYQGFADTAVAPTTSRSRRRSCSTTTRPTGSAWPRHSLLRRRMRARGRRRTVVGSSSTTTPLYQAVKAGADLVYLGHLRQQRRPADHDKVAVLGPNSGRSS